MVLVDFSRLQNVFSKANAPATWPGVMIRNVREYLAKAGLPTIITEVFPENESDGTWLSKFHCKGLLPTTRPKTSLPPNREAKSFLRVSLNAKTCVQA